MRPHRTVLALAIIAAAVAITACGPRIPNAPDTYRGDECSYAAEIIDAWAGTGSETWAVDTAIRESRCQPGARNPSGASGIFQLMWPLHARLIADVCGHADPFDPHCNISAARALYDGAGRAPWNF